MTNEFRRPRVDRAEAARLTQDLRSDQRTRPAFRVAREMLRDPPPKEASQ